MNAALTRATAAAIVALAASAFAACDAGAATPNNRYLLLDNAFYRDYPAVGSTVAELPQGYIPVSFSDETFYFQGGVWYLESSPEYIVVDPPTGIQVPNLPPGYTTVSVGDTAYFYSTGIYYVAVLGGYEVTLAPLDPSLGQPNPDSVSPDMD